MKKFPIYLMSSLAICATTTYAADEKVANDDMTVRDAAKEFPGVTPEEYQAFQKLPDSKFDRKLADGASEYTGYMSDAYVAMGNRIRNLKDVESLAKLIAELDDGYDKYKDADLKLLALETAQLRPLRGIIYRMIPIVENNKVTHSALLTKMMKMATRMGIYSPTTQSKLVMAYLTQPYDFMTRFQTPYELQRFVRKEAYDAVWKSTDRLMKLNLEERSKDKKPGKLVVDSSVFYSGVGMNHYTDPNTQYNFFQEGERHVFLAMKFRTLKDQNAFTAFNIDKLADLTTELGKLYGMETFRDKIAGISTRDIHDVIMKPQFATMFVANSSAPVAMGNVQYFTNQMVLQLGEAWKSLKEDRVKVDLSGIINPAVANAFSDSLEHVLPVWEDMMKGDTRMVAKTTGDVIHVNVPAYYAAFTSKSPSAEQAWARDLKHFLPTTFYTTPLDSNCTSKNQVHVKMFAVNGIGDHPTPGMISKQITVKDEKGKDTKIFACYRDYRSGSPIGWDVKAYKSIYPGLQKSDMVDSYQRILKQSEGGRLVANLIDWVID